MFIANIMILNHDWSKLNNQGLGVISKSNAVQYSDMNNEHLLSVTGKQTKFLLKTFTHYMNATLTASFKIL